VAVLIAEGKIFSSGLDLKEYGALFAADLSDTDPARFASKFY
jgi:enoyl-CoA hydratase/carnithine racemase